MLTPAGFGGGGREWHLFYDRKPWSTNRERSRMHWSERSALVLEFRQMFRIMAINQRIPRPIGHPVHVIATPHAADGRWIQDVGNCYPAVKAAIDGLVDAKVLPDDSGEYLAGITLTRTEISGKAGLALIVAEIVDEAVA